MIFPGRSKAEVMPQLEDLRRSVAEAGFVLRGQARKNQTRKARGRKTGEDNRVGVTISIGVADRQPRRQLPEEVMIKADQALYRAKAAGRNRVIG